MNWIDVVDTGYITVRLNHKAETSKRNEERFYSIQDERKLVYIDFSSNSHSLIRKYTYQSCNPSEEEYSEYIHLFNKVQILSEDSLRACASNTFNSVTQYIIANKSYSGDATDKDIMNLHDDLNSAAKESIAIFQKMAQIQVAKYYTSK
jgi:hypothetical protein